MKVRILLRRFNAPVGEVGGVALSYVCLYCRCLPLEDYSWWVSSGHVDGDNREEETMQLLCAAHGGQCDWRAPNGALVRQDTEDLRESEKFFEHTLHRKVCVITRSSP